MNALHKRQLPGVGFEYCGFDFNRLCDEEILDFGAGLAADKVVLVRGQVLNEARLHHILEVIGRVLKPGQFFNHPDYPGLYRVTNERKDGKKIGIFADKELDWHSNGNGRPANKECNVMLYCVQPGHNSITSFCDMERSYNDLPQGLKDLVNDIECVYKFKNNTFYSLDEDDKELAVFENQEFFPEGLVKPLAYTHPFDLKRGLYFSYHYIHRMWRRSGGALDEVNLLSLIKNHVFQDKYIYHHSDWRSGDLIFMDQYHTIHRRNEVQGTRFLYRATFDYRHSWRKHHGKL